MTKSRNSRGEMPMPSHVAYAAYLFPTPGAFRMYLRGLSLVNLEHWRPYAAALPPYHAQALTDELSYRAARPYMHAGGHGG